MTDALRRLLRRAEFEAAAPISAQEARRWGLGAVDHFVALGLLRKTTPAKTIRYDGCEHGCHMTPEIVTHAVTGEQFGVHGCSYDCGLVRIPLDDLRQWEFDLIGAAKAVARAIDAGSQVAEDIPGRLVEVGRVVAGDLWRDVFLARGLAWSDASSAFADARRLKASAAPLVLGLELLPGAPVWTDCKPALALLIDIASLEDGSLKVDLTGVVERPTKPHADAVASEWLTVTQAAERLVAEDVLDDLDLARAKALVSTAASRGHLVTNSEQGRGRRIESGSLAAWMLEQRRKNLKEENDTPKPKRPRARGASPRQPFR